MMKMSGVMAPFEEPGTIYKCEGHEFVAEVVRHEEHNDDRWQIWRASTCSIYVICNVYNGNDQPFWRSIFDHNTKEEAIKTAVRVHKMRMMQSLARIREFEPDWINEEAVRKSQERRSA